MFADEIVRLEALVERLLKERSDLLQRNAVLAGERDRFSNERARVAGELDSLLAKLDCLERKSR